MTMPEAIKAVTEKRDLTVDEMNATMRLIMTGEATPAQVGGFLVGLRMKGETIDEIVAAATVMRELASKVDVDTNHLVDTCGTGGDSSGSFNISTASAIVVAAAGGKVAKHGNRSITSKSGSADVLETAGVNLELSPEAVASCVNEIGVGFMFAPMHHSAMKHAIGPRREMAVRTIFNVLGPLTNPAGAPNQVMGVFSKELVEPIAHVLQRLGSEHVLVVHAEDGMDEISIATPTFVAELNNGEVSTYTIQPEDFGMTRASLEEIRATDSVHSLEIIRAVFDNTDGPAKDIVSLNAGAAIYAAGLTSSLADGVSMAQQVIASGSVSEKLDQLISTTNAAQ
jgi:anthranilate phosphoribosyltransferase